MSSTHSPETTPEYSPNITCTCAIRNATEDGHVSRRTLRPQTTSIYHTEVFAVILRWICVISMLGTPAYYFQALRHGASEDALWDLYTEELLRIAKLSGGEIATVISLGFTSMLGTNRIASASSVCSILCNLVAITFCGFNVGRMRSLEIAGNRDAWVQSTTANTCSRWYTAVLFLSPAATWSCWATLATIVYITASVLPADAEDPGTYLPPSDTTRYLLAAVPVIGALHIVVCTFLFEWLCGRRGRIPIRSLSA